VQGSCWRNRPGGFDFGAYASFVGREVFCEKIRKLLCGCIKGRLVGPNIARNQYFGGYVWAFAHARLALWWVGSSPLVILLSPRGRLPAALDSRLHLLSVLQVTFEQWLGPLQGFL